MYITRGTVTGCVSQFLPKSNKFSGRAKDEKSKVALLGTLSVPAGSLENWFIVPRKGNEVYVIILNAIGAEEWSPLDYLLSCNTFLFSCSILPKSPFFKIPFPFQLFSFL